MPASFNTINLQLFLLNCFISNQISLLKRQKKTFSALAAASLASCCAEKKFLNQQEQEKYFLLLIWELSLWERNMPLVKGINGFLCHLDEAASL